jgi:hypothetical protein
VRSSLAMVLVGAVPLVDGLRLMMAMAAPTANSASNASHWVSKVKSGSAFPYEISEVSHESFSVFREVHNHERC